MSLREFGDAVGAYNAAQDKPGAVLTDTEQDALAREMGIA